MKPWQIVTLFVLALLVGALLLRKILGGKPNLSGLPAPSR